MQIHLGLSTLRAEWSRAVVCVGTYDGVHLGHREVIDRARAVSEEKGLPLVLVTFDRHPAAILAPDQCPLPICGLEENLIAFRKRGVAVSVILPFDAAMSRLSAEGFLRRVLQEGVRAAHVVVGHDFAMGNGREGDAAWLSERISTTVVPPFLLDGERVSSTQVRRAIVDGDLALAERLLGRPFAIRGVVVQGQRLGRTLGYPTANMARSLGQIEPPNGVYAGRAETRHGTYWTAVGIGTRPTVAGEGRTIEPYLLDYPGDSLYGSEVRLELIAKLRDEETFADLHELKVAMARDVERVRAIARERA